MLMGACDVPPRSLNHHENMRVLLDVVIKQCLSNSNCSPATIKRVCKTRAATLTWISVKKMATVSEASTCTTMVLPVKVLTKICIVLSCVTTLVRKTKHLEIENRCSAAMLDRNLTVHGGRVDVFFLRNNLSQTHSDKIL